MSREDGSLTAFLKVVVVGGRDDLNVSGAFSRGWNFYCGLKGTGQTIFFPATGACFGIGILSNVGQKF